MRKYKVVDVIIGDRNDPRNWEVSDDEIRAIEEADELEAEDYARELEELAELEGGDE